MKYIYAPGPPLSDYVTLLWLEVSESLPHARERVFPTGAATLVISLARRRATISGPHSRPLLLRRDKLGSHAGVFFRPGGAYPFFGPPADALHNQIVSLESFWGSVVLDLRGRLLGVPTLAARLRILEAFLLTRLDTPAKPHPAVSSALDAFRHPETVGSIRDLAALVGLSSRRLRQVFRQQVGLSPKRFHRLQRFQGALRRIHGQQQVDWARLARAHGYYDQAHFIHDFRAFAGLSPTAYLDAQGAELNHVPLRE